MTIALQHAARTSLACVLLVALGDAAALPPETIAQATLPITQARPATGSRLRRELPKLTIPATDPYDRLTPAQKTEFRAMFSNLADGDEPPYPTEGLLPIAKTLAFVLSDATTPLGEGELLITVRVDENGEPLSTSVYATPSSRVSREAATVLMSVKYKPATCAGKPCTSEFPFTARFTD